MKIDANGRKIREILERKICYEIPDYQRPYSWTKDHPQLTATPNP